MSCAVALAPARPAQVRDITGVTAKGPAASIVRVSTRNSWLEFRDDFFVWFDRAKEEAEFTYDSDVAKAAGMSHTTISGWRSGRQRPNSQSLSDVARVLNKSAQEAWARAGLMTASDIHKAEAPSIREDLATINRAIKDPNTDPEDLVVIEATLEMLLARLSGRAKRNAA
jgi:transcriptional regulator with XRE-family HTH domain